ncbi:MAG: hypothetical protein AAGG68_09180 [Bacteroidota bacterium]
MAYNKMEEIMVEDSNGIKCHYYGVPSITKDKEQFILCKLLFYSTEAGVFKDFELLKVSDLLFDGKMLPDYYKFRQIGYSILLHGNIRKRGKLKWKRIKEGNLSIDDLTIPYFRTGKLTNEGTTNDSVSVISMTSQKRILVSQKDASNLPKYGYSDYDFATYKANFMLFKRTQKEVNVSDYFDLNDIRNVLWKSWAYEQVFGVRP